MKKRKPPLNGQGITSKHNRISHVDCPLRRSKNVIELMQMTL